VSQRQDESAYAKLARVSESQVRKIVVLATSQQFQGKNFLLPVDDPCYRDIVEHLIQGYAVDYNRGSRS
jgi:hypothetical protein